tara:strand:- start:1126 stop:1368 length:243 start_codon:yes stop_codon:yes gene_type:complete
MIPSGYEGYRVYGNLLITTNSDSIWYMNNDKDAAIEIAAFSTSENRCFEIEAIGYVYVKNGSVYQELDKQVNPIKFKEFK